MVESAQAFVIALASYWWAIMGGIFAPLVLDVPKLLPDKWEARINDWLPRPRKIRLALITGLVGLVLAAFLAFHDERTRVDKPVLVGIRYSQESIPSTNPELPYGLKVVVQTDKTIQLSKIVLVFDGDVGEGNFSIADVGMYQGGAGVGIGRPNTFLAKLKSPEIKPETPMIFKVYSKSAIKVVGFAVQ